jgi:predicted MFS family arabinose efflux permease
VHGRRVRADLPVAVAGRRQQRRGAALGTFTAFFDIGFLVGGPLTGLAAELGGYSAAFWLGSAFALATIVVAGSLRQRAAAVANPATG